VTEQRNPIQAATGSLAAVIQNSELILTCGPGGVGKTTTAAALGVAAARAGRRTVVVTVDPARRLAEALGLEEGAAADEPHRVKGVTKRATDGELWALMLDAEQTFDRLVREQSSSRKQADAVLNNPVYQAISGSLSGAQEYMAVERLHQLHSSGEWDLVIVDTPPSRHAIDLLEAPDRLVGFLSHPVYRTLTMGQRTFAKITDAASSMFLRSNASRVPRLWKTPCSSSGHLQTSKVGSAREPKRCLDCCAATTQRLSLSRARVQKRWAKPSTCSMPLPRKTSRSAV
jgi:energy-coupling factor transporter ATP-binding protein EcfA2